METNTNKRFRIPSVLFAVLCWVGSLAAQDPELPTSPKLEAAILVEEVEHDPERALELYRGLAADEGVDAGVRRHAWLRVAELTQRLKPEDRETIEAALGNAISGADDALAASAKALRDAPRPDLERERALRERAGELIEAFLKGETVRFVQNMHWIGEPAVREIAARARDRDWYRTNRDQERLRAMLRAMLQVAWLVDSEPSRELLLAALGEPGLMGLEEDAAMAVAALQGVGDKVPAANRDLWNDLIRAEPDLALPVLQHVGQVMAWTDLAVALAHPAEAVRKWAAEIAKGRLFNSSGVQPETAAMLLAPARSFLGAIDPEQQRLGQELLILAARRSGEARSELIARLDEMRQGFVSLPPWAPDPTRRAEQLEALQRQSVALGPRYPDSPSRAIAAWLAAGLVADAIEAGDAGRDEVLAALRLVRGGYLQWRAVQKLVPVSLADDVVAELAGSDALLDALNWLGWLDLSAASFPALAASFPALAALDPGQSYREGWLRALASTGAPGAAELLRTALLQGDAADHLDPMATVQIALRLSAERDDEPSRALLRDLIVARGQRVAPDHLTVDNPWDLLVARLVQVGDVDVLRQMRSIDAVREVPQHQRSTWYPESILPAWLDAGRLSFGAPLLLVGPDGVAHWHGYDATRWIEVWQVLLDEHQGRYWQDAWQWTADLLLAESLRTPELERSVLEAWARRVAADATLEAGEGLALEGVLGAVSPQPGSTDPAAAAHQRLIDAALGAPSSWARSVALRQLDPGSDRGLGEALHAIADAEHQVRHSAWKVLENRQGRVERATAQRAVDVLESFDDLQTEFEWFGERVDADSALPFAELLDHPDQRTRLMAIQVLAAPMDIAVVPPLLKATAHPDPTTRAAARDALDAIRYHVEQTAHWERVFSGAAQLGRSRAAAKLLDQAAPEQPSARRVLAIRSLGALGEPEVLPFLVEWSESEDAAVAAAAKASIEQLVTASRR